MDHPSTPDAVGALRALIVSGEQFRQAIADHFGVGVTETVALSHLRVHGALTSGELAELAGLTSSTVTALVDRLEGFGLADRSAHPTDRRKIVIALTPSGKDQLDRTEEWLAAALQVPVGMDPAAVTTLLTRLAAALDQQTLQISELPPADTAPQ
ncbi:MarR family winged helix-turn-helix transcriptional regulator [Leekyejoonella antrihumi]|nr:MarR family winged helix-turn-helix transcriptional regulator [Leekyejoonella antrihumi]